MGYFVPTFFVKVGVGNDCAVPAHRISAIMNTSAYQAREAIKAQKREKRLINAAGRSQAKSAIFLDNEIVVAAPVTVQTIINRTEKAMYRIMNGLTKNSKEEKEEEEVDEVGFADDEDPGAEPYFADEGD